MSISNIVRQTKNPYLLGTDGELGRQTEYFAQESIDFIKSLGRFADNHYRIQIQKWGETELQTVECRIEDSFDEQANLKRGDDWKDILFYEPIPDITIGMLAFFEGNTWLGFNTRNIAGLTSSITVRRCDNVLNFRDEFNNVTAIPFLFDKYVVLNSTTIEKASEPISLINGYQNAWVQYNEWTAAMKTNDRFIINGQAWTVRGIDSTSRLYTNERNSVRLMSFALMRSEEREDDDLVNDIAVADNNVWTITTDITEIVGAVGDTGAIHATLTHNGTVDNTYPVTFSTSDNSIVTVDENGSYEIVGHGTATITCSFSKNEAICTTIGVNATARASDDGIIVSFENAPQILMQYDAITLNAYVYQSGTKDTITPITFTASGVPSIYYDIYDVSTNSLTIECLAPYGKDKLNITAKAEVSGIEYGTTIELSLINAI